MSKDFFWIEIFSAWLAVNQIIFEHLYEFPSFVVVEVQINALAVIPSQIGKQTADRQRNVQKILLYCTLHALISIKVSLLFCRHEKKISSKLIPWHLIPHNSYYIMYAVPGLLEIQISTSYLVLFLHDVEKFDQNILFFLTSV